MHLCTERSEWIGERIGAEWERVRRQRDVVRIRSTAGRLELALAGHDAPREWLAAQADVGLDERVRCIKEHSDAEFRALAQEERVTDVFPS